MHWDPRMPLPKRAGWLGLHRAGRAQQLQQRKGREGWPSRLGGLISSAKVPLQKASTWLFP